MITNGYAQAYNQMSILVFLTHYLGSFAQSVSALAQPDGLGHSH